MNAIEVATLLAHCLEKHSGYAGNYKIKNMEEAPVNLHYLRGLHDGVHRVVGTSVNDHPYGEGKYIGENGDRS